MKTKEQIIKETIKELKELGIYRFHKEVEVEVYAQSVIDWRKAVREAEIHGEVNTMKNNMNQVNAYHTQKSHYAALIKQYSDKIFKEDKLKVGKKGDSEDKGTVSSILK